MQTLKHLNTRLTTFANTRLWVFEAISLSIALLGNFLLQLNAFLGLDYHSDDISQQVLTHKWLADGFSGTWLGPDPFLVKVPFHFIIELFFGQSRISILVSASVLSGLMIVCAFFGLRYFAKMKPKAGLSYLYFLALFPWAGSIFSFAMMASFKNANLRTVELGIWFLMLPLAVKLLSGVYKQSRKLLGVLLFIAIGIGFLCFNDSAMIYFCLVPLASFAGITILLNRKSFKEDRLPVLLISTIAASLIFYKIWQIIFTLGGFHFYHSSVKFVEFEKFWTFINQAFYNFLALFNADIFGMPLRSLSTGVKLLNVVVLVLCISACLYLIIRGNKWARFFALQPPFLFTLYAVSGFATDVSTARYLILVPFYFVIILFYILEEIHSKGYLRLSLVASLLVVTTMLANIFSYAYWSVSAIRKYRAGAEQRNYIEQRVAGVAVEKGLSKGYATFGYANLINYFSDYSTTMTPLYCGNKTIQPFYLLMTDAALLKPSDRSFVLSLEPSSGSFVENEYPALNLPAGMDYSCSAEKIVASFGEPREVVGLNQNISMYVYDYDILKQLNLERTSKTSPIN